MQNFIVTGDNIENKGDVIYVNYNKNNIVNNSMKEIIIYVDVSRSMDKYIDEIKEHVDIFVNSKVNVTIKTFNTHITTVTNLNNIECRGLTDLGNLVSTAISDISDKYTWVLIFTDGQINKGKMRTVESFQRLNYPDNAKFYTFGYGDYNVDILKTIGKNIHPDVSYFNKLLQQIYESNIFNIELDFVSNYNNNVDLNDDSLILDLNLTEGEYIRGSSKVFDTSSFPIIYLPYGNIKDTKLLSSYHLIISYHKLDSDNYSNKTYREVYNVDI